MYFDESYEGEYPKEAPFTGKVNWKKFILTASGKSKEDEAYKNES